MPRNDINRLQKLLKKTRGYKNSVVFSNRLFFNSEAGEVKRDDLIKRYEEVKQLIEEAIGGSPLRYVEGQHLKVFEWAYSDRDLKLARACIRLAPEFIVRTIAYHSGEKVKPGIDQPTTAIYIQPDIIEKFKQRKDDFDYSKLIALLEEINFNYKNQKPYASAALIRAVLDHIPPLLGFTDYIQLANHYKGGETIGKHLKKLFAWRDTADDSMHSPIDTVSNLIVTDYLPQPIQLDRLLRECLKSNGKVVKQQAVQKQSKEVTKLAVKVISDMSWANYSVGRHWIWSCFRVAIEIDNCDNDKPDFISVFLTGKLNNEEWIGKFYYFENSDSANTPYKIEGYDLKNVGVYLSNIDFGNSQRLPMPELEQGTVMLNVNSKRGAKLKIPIQSIKRG